MAERLKIITLNNPSELPETHIYQWYIGDTVEECVESYRKWFAKEPECIYIYAQKVKDRMILHVYIQHKEIPHDDGASASIQQ